MSIAIPESAYFRLVAIAQWLDPPTRTLFYQDLVRALQGRDLGEGTVSRAINLAFRAHYQAPPESEGRRAGKPLRKLNDIRRQVA